MAGQPDNSTTFGKGSVPSKAGKSCPHPDIESGPSASAARGKCTTRPLSVREQQQQISQQLPGLDDHEQREKKYPFEYDDDCKETSPRAMGVQQTHE